MRVVDLYKVLYNDVFIRIINENGEHIMWGKPFDIPLGVLDCIVKSIRKAGDNSIYDIEIVIE